MTMLAVTGLHLDLKFTIVLNMLNSKQVLMLIFKGELNLYNKWQSDDLFHIVINENHPRGNRF